MGWDIQTNQQKVKNETLSLDYYISSNKYWRNFMESQGDNYSAIRWNNTGNGTMHTGR